MVDRRRDRIHSGRSLSWSVDPSELDVATAAARGSSLLQRLASTHRRSARDRQHEPRRSTRHTLPAGPSRHRAPSSQRHLQTCTGRSEAVAGPRRSPGRDRHLGAATSSRSAPVDQAAEQYRRPRRPRGDGARARCTAPDPCPRGTAQLRTVPETAAPAPCRSAPRPRAPAARATPRARRRPSGSARRSGVGGALEQRHHAPAISSCLQARRPPSRRSRCPVVRIEPEQQRRDPLGLRLPADADDHAVGGLLRLHLDDRATLTRPVRRSSRFATTPSSPSASKRSSQPSASSCRARR